MEQKKDFSNLFLSHSALIFLKASETRNFSETAKFFRITQSAVSRSMREWEKSWGCPLFDRSSRPISLTAEGRIINQELQKHLKSFLDLADSIRKESNLKPVVRVGCVESLSVDLLPKLILQLRDKTRQIVTILATSNSLHRELLEGKLDIIISSDSTAELSGRQPPRTAKIIKRLQLLEILERPSILRFALYQISPCFRRRQIK